MNPAPPPTLPRCRSRHRYLSDTRDKMLEKKMRLERQVRTKQQTGLIKCHDVYCLQQATGSPWRFLQNKLPSAWQWLFFFFNFFFQHLFIFGTERQSIMNGGGAEREGDTESETGSRLRAISPEPDAGLKLTDRKIVTWLKSDA